MSGARRIAGPLVAGLVVAAYAAALRRYGIFDHVDEGLLLVQAWRAAHGQVPYVDFHTGYGPLYFRVQGLLVAAGGLEAVRLGLVAVHGTSAALLYALARRLAGPGLAAAAVALEVAFFLPVAPGRGAPFNTPYPAWYAGLGGVALALLLATERPAGAVRAALAGVLSGLVFATKPNSGLLLAAGAAGAIALGDARGTPGWAARATLLLLGVAAAVLVVPSGATLVAWVLVPPAFALAVLGVERGAPDEEALRRLAALAAAFGLIAVVAFAPTLATLGPGAFAREVLLVGAGVAGVYGLGLPAAAAAASLIGLLAFIARGRPARGFVLAGAAVLVLPLASAAVRLEPVATALRVGAEEAALAALPLVVWGALSALRRAPEPVLVAPTTLAVTGALQLYPRADFAHLAPLGVLILPLALRLWRAAAALVPLTGTAARAVVLALPCLAAAARFMPTANVLARASEGRLVEVQLGAARLVIEPEGSAALRAVEAAAEQVRFLPPDEPVLVFPACGMVPFVAERRPAGPHDYFFPGRPDRAEGGALAARLAAAPPRLAVICSAADTPLAAAWNYYPELVELLTTRYSQLAVLPPYRVLELR